MASKNPNYRGPVTISYSAGGALAVIEFDATLGETHPFSNVITEHPVEKGVNVTDHVRPEVDRVTVEAFVTNAPTRVPGSNLDGATGSVQNLELDVPTTTDLPIQIPGVGAALRGSGALRGTLAVQAQTLQFDDFDRVGSIFHELKTLQEAATLVTIATSLREYADFVIQSVNVPRQAGEGDAVRITIEARQLRFVTTKTVPAPKEPVGVKTVNKGPKPGTAVPKSSLALKAAQAIGLAH